MRSWPDVPGWTCPRLLEFYDRVANTVTSGAVVEVGCAYGRSLTYLLGRIGPAVRVYGVDTWAEHQGGDNLPPEVFAALVARGDPATVCRESVTSCFELASPKLDQLRLCKGKSVDIAKTFRDGELDVVFIDADHSYEGVRDDIAAWRTKVHQGGWLAGHDANRHFPGVLRAVEEAFWTNYSVKTNDDGWGGVWLHRVPE